MRNYDWAYVPAGDGRCLVFSPRFGSTYLLSPELQQNPLLLFLLGLHRRNQVKQLDDPAAAVDLVGAFEKPLAMSSPKMSDEFIGTRPSWFLRKLYVWFHGHRKIFSVGRVIRLGKLLAALSKKRSASEVSEIGKIILAVENAAGISDCYPRALLTACLCLQARLSCKITIGILAPTSKLHAWCSTEGVIPYEPVYHHWWYQPLIVFDVQSKQTTNE